MTVSSTPSSGNVTTVYYTDEDGNQLYTTTELTHDTNTYYDSDAWVKEIDRIKSVIDFSERLVKFDVQRLVGLPEDVVQRFCVRIGLDYEVIERDGIDIPIAHDLKPHRLRVAIDGGLVEHCYLG